MNDDELVRRDAAGMLEYRRDAIRVRWAVMDLPTADAHTVDCRFACSVRVADTDADRKMLAEVFAAAGDAVTARNISDHFTRIVRATLARLSAERAAQDIVSGSQQQEWIAALTEAAKPAAFAAGLELLPPFQLDVESPSLQRQKLEEIARARSQQRAAGQLQQLQRATDLLKQFQQMRQSAPELSAGKLLEQMSPTDRGPALQALLLASSAEAAGTALWAVAGPFLVRINPRTTPPETKLIQLPTALGPLRSVQPAVIEGRRVLLVGARGGVMIVSPDAPAEAQLYAHPDLNSPLGFNRIVSTGRELWASHSEAGIVGWRIGQTSAPHRATVDRIAVPRPQSATLSTGSLGGSGDTLTAGPRNLQLLDADRLIYSIAHELVIRHAEERQVVPSHSQAEIISIIPTSRAMIIVHQDGSLVVLDRTTRQPTDVRRRGGRLTAACVMPWLGDTRLLLAGDTGPIDCIGLEDPLVSEYLSPYRGLKIVTAAADIIAAVSPDRQRIVIWQTWDPQRPGGEVHVTSKTRHRIADVDFDS